MKKQEEQITVTKHAQKRARKRLSWKKGSINRMARKAYKNGVTLKDTHGGLKIYLKTIVSRSTDINAIRIYGENLYLFVDKVLVTIYKVPNRYNKHLNI